MTIDISNPAHVEALREACSEAMHPGEFRRLLVPIRAHVAARGIVSRSTKEAAMLVLSDPILASKLLRRLLDRCGVGWFARLYDVVDTAAPLPPFDGEAPYPGEWIALDKMPRIILALLDAPDRAAALAALRGER